MEKKPAHDRRATDIPLNAQIAPVEVDNPYAGVTDTDRTIIAIRSIKNDPLAWLHTHHHIDEAEYRAGRYWQMLHTRSNIGAIKAVDITKEPVDGGGLPEMLTDARQDAMIKLRAAGNHLGPTRSKLIWDVLGAGMFIGQAAEIRGAKGRTDLNYWSRELHESLNQLAIFFTNYIGRRRAA